MKLSSSHLLLLPASLFTCIYASPTPSGLVLNPQATASNLSTTILGNPFECWVSKSHSQRAKFEDCAKAIALLPNLDVHGTFHIGGESPDDPFALPHAEQSGPCRVSITMQPTSMDPSPRDGSSWDTINIAALEVIEACAMGYVACLILFRGV